MEWQAITIGDGSAWAFFNGDWADGEEGALRVPDACLRQDGPAMQGHHYAFFRGATYSDLQARFWIRLMPHSDAGLIFRAADASHFYLLHVPNCGQASRAQHFWAALSLMDESGYLRLLKMEMVRRVPSNVPIRLEVEARVQGDEVSVRIGEHGIFRASDATRRQAGCVGAYLFGSAEIGGLAVEGQATRPKAGWSGEPRRNWFHPCPDSDYGQWQRPGDLIWTPAGDLLLAYSVQTVPHTGTVTHLTARSVDKGRTWSKPTRLDVPADDEWQSPRFHVFPDGRLKMLVRQGDGFLLFETEDDGRTWCSPLPVEMGPNPPGIERLYVPPQSPINLSDGTTLLFLYAAHASGMKHTGERPTVRTWGATHCQCFSCRSEDGGRSWSPPVNLDNPGLRPDGTAYDGNLDLTEAGGVETGDGRILALIRPIYSPWMWETWSSDGGTSWGPCVRGPFPGYAAPNMLRTASGTILVAHRLPGLTIHTSLDDGRTWDEGAMIDSAVWAMGSMVEVEPNVVLYVYFDSFESLMRGQFIRVTPKGLEPATDW